MTVMYSGTISTWMLLSLKYSTDSSRPHNISGKNEEMRLGINERLIKYLFIEHYSSFYLETYSCKLFNLKQEVSKDTLAKDPPHTCFYLNTDFCFFCTTYPPTQK